MIEKFCFRRAVLDMSTSSHGGEGHHEQTGRGTGEVGMESGPGWTWPFCATRRRRPTDASERVHRACGVNLSRVPAGLGLPDPPPSFSCSSTALSEGSQNGEMQGLSDWTPHPARGHVVQFFPGHHDCCLKPLETLLRNASLKPPFPRWDGLACVRAQSLQSCPTLCDPMDCSPPGSSVCGDSPGKNTGVGCHALLRGIFPTQGSNRVSCVCCTVGGFFIY